MSEEVKSTLDKLKAEGYKMAIGSSSKNVSIILKRLGLEDFFDKISDGNNISKYSKTTYKLNNFKEILDIV